MEVYQRDIVSQLAGLLALLLPGSAEEDIGKSVAKFIKKAIRLKTALIEEQAVYQCYWVQCGEHFDAEMMDISGEESGLVCICTFAGLARSIRNDDGKAIVRAVKASAVLESAFIMQN
jgi:hypothetical protein